MLSLGIDDAGRGPLIGPMILAGAVLDKKTEEILKKQGVKDSKLVTHSKRILLAKEIEKTAKSFKVVKVYPTEIDNSLTRGTNLNTLEAMKCAEIINELIRNISEDIKIIVDCPSVNTIAWRSTLLSLLENTQVDILCEHKADTNHVSAAAASILAKVTREEEVFKIKSQFGEIGSGYPSDPSTKKFLKLHGKEFIDKGIFRKTWSTWKKVFPSPGQEKLF